MNFDWKTWLGVIGMTMATAFVVSFFGDIDRQLNEWQKTAKGEKRWSQKKKK